MRCRILFVMPTLGGGGAERVVSILINSFINRKYDVFLALTKKNDICYKLNGEVTIEVLEGNSNPIRQMFFIRKIAEKHNVDTVFSFLTYQNMYTLSALLFSKKRVIVSERNDPSKTARGVAKLFRNVLYNRANAIVFQTTMAKEYFCKTIQDKGRIIANPIDSCMLPYPNDGNKEKRIVCVARLEEQKNIFMLIRGYEKFLEINDSYVLEIYGEGGLRGSIEQYISSRNLQGKVILKGFVKEVYKNISNASVFTLTSNHEGMSNAMLEALAMGIPCICTDCPAGAAREFIVDGKNGFLIPVNDEEALCDALQRVLVENEVVDACVYAELIREKLDVSNICCLWEALV